jgi:hypothetical protein
MRLSVLAAIGGCLILMAGSLQAQDCPEGKICAYVRQDVAPSGDTYQTISAALAAVSKGYNHIIVYPGIYTDNVVISGPLVLESVDGPLLTCLDGSSGTDTVTVAEGAQGVRIVGFNITGGSRGVLVETSSTVAIHNCIIDSNSAAGIEFSWTYGKPVTSLTARNNVIMNTTQGPGILMDIALENQCCPSWAWHTQYGTFQGNIIWKNAGTGISIVCRARAIGNTAPLSRERLTFSHNLLIENALGPYNTPISEQSGTGVHYTPGAGNLYQAALNFREVLNTCALDVRLGNNSSARDKGPASYPDPDGTRNDMGAFGGPYAARFFESVNDGPIVRDIIAPKSVRKGETITIEATGVSR